MLDPLPYLLSPGSVPIANGGLDCDDSVYCTNGQHYCIVVGYIYGPFDSREVAIAAMEAMQRTIDRKGDRLVRRLRFDNDNCGQEE